MTKRDGIELAEQLEQLSNIVDSTGKVNFVIKTQWNELINIVRKLCSSNLFDALLITKEERILGDIIECIGELIYYIDYEHGFLSMKNGNHLVWKEKFDENEPQMMRFDLIFDNNGEERENQTIKECASRLLHQKGMTVTLQPEKEENINKTDMKKNIEIKDGNNSKADACNKKDNNSVDMFTEMIRDKRTPVAVLHDVKDRLKELREELNPFKDSYLYKNLNDTINRLFDLYDEEYPDIEETEIDGREIKKETYDKELENLKITAEADWIANKLFGKEKGEYPYSYKDERKVVKNAINEVKKNYEKTKDDDKPQEALKDENRVDKQTSDKTIETGGYKYAPVNIAKNNRFIVDLLFDNLNLCCLVKVFNVDFREKKIYVELTEDEDNPVYEVLGDKWLKGQVHNENITCSRLSSKGDVTATQRFENCRVEYIGSTQNDYDDIANPKRIFLTYSFDDVTTVVPDTNCWVD